MTTLTLTEEETLILQDALAEYISARGPTVPEYIDRRYPADEYGDGFQKRKTVTVAARLKLASDLRGRLFDDPTAG